MKRKNITMSEKIATWYEQEAKDMGVTQSALMTMALKNYIDQMKALEMAQSATALNNLLIKLEGTEKND